MEKCSRKQEMGKKAFIVVFGTLSIIAFGFQSSNSNIKIENAYIGVAAKGMTGAVYFKISNSSDSPDTLYQVNADFAMMAQLHESFRKNGMTGMKGIRDVVIPAKSIVVFKPGGYHVMLMNVKQDLKTGMKFGLMLMFRQAGKIEITAPVK